MSISAFAPASVGNFGPCFDVLGFALSEPGDTVTVRKTNIAGVKITSITGDDGKLSKDPKKNTAGVAALEILKKLKTKEGVEMEIAKDLPIGSGIGSSAASAVAAAFAVNELFGKKLKIEELFDACLKGEESVANAAHGDNVLPSLLGGVVQIESYAPLKIKRITAPELVVVIFTPEHEVTTKKSRAVLTDEMKKALAEEAPAKAERILKALAQEDLVALGKAVGDNKILETARGKLIPGFKKIQQAALEAGAYACTIAGAGPSLFALVDDEDVGEIIGFAMQEVLFEDSGTDSKVKIVKMSNEGARRISNV
jgi:homoserine kinase